MNLTNSITTLKGVGPRKARSLGQLGIQTIDDLLHHFPSRWVFPDDHEYTVVRGTVKCVAEKWQALYCSVATENMGTVSICWYNGTRLRHLVTKGCGILAMGIMNRDAKLVNPEFRVAPDPSGLDVASLRIPTYPVVSGITSKDISRAVRSVLPYESIEQNLRKIHDPKSREEFDQAIQDEKYKELFYMQLALAIRSAQRKRAPSNLQCVPTPRSIEDYFPFEFTNDQRQAVWDIYGDLCSPSAMNRLLQGEVGSGKTAVAAYAAMVVACNGGQTAILCPTRILAEQHYKSVNNLFRSAGLNCELVITDAPSVRGQKMCFEPRLDRTDVVIGTTAILGDLHWDNLALVVIDEQHKFGVEQRAALQQHGNPHVLMMTATPIPRTIAMTAFGDLDVSVIREMPPGRKPVETKWVSPNPKHYGFAYATALETIGDELSQGHQVYVVCPRIEALDDEMRAVEEVVEEYADLFPTYAVSSLHGRMTPSDKELAARSWATGATSILVSTTVVEIGVDCPNATVMVVEGAERFGLAQLHQLRGRVGRSEHQSYCFLLSDTDSSDGRARLQVMERTSSGFEIAEQDIKLRGPGDLFSTRQHGLPDLRVADIVEDFDLLVQAREEARRMVQVGGASPQAYGYHLDELKRRYGDVLHLGGIG